MGRKLVLTALAVVVTGVVVWFASAGHRRNWTTSSPEALVELDRGLEAQAKIYQEEAREHFANAVRLDPSFAVAKLFLVLSGEKSSSESVRNLIAELRKVDLEVLTPRERFLLSYTLASYEHRRAEAADILRSYLSAAPNDPFALNYQARSAVSEQDWTTAQHLFEKLIEVAPNRVEAYNELGYLAMAQERFRDSENMFRTYHYLAPDQANPRDSLGELLALTGRYNEAEREFYAALETKPDFFVSLHHLVVMSFLDLDTTRVDRAVAHASKAKTCTVKDLHELECTAALVRAAASRSWESIWQAGLGDCAKSMASSDRLRFHAAAWTGRSDEAEAWVDKTKAALAKQEADSYSSRWLQVEIAHLEGVRSLAAGRATEAAASFASADRGLAYRGLGDGMFKLLNRLNWRAALQASGDRAASERIGSEISRVNPAVLAVWEGFERPSPALPVSGRTAEPQPGGLRAESGSLAH